MSAPIGVHIRHPALRDLPFDDNEDQYARLQADRAYSAMMKSLYPEVAPVRRVNPIARVFPSVRNLAKAADAVNEQALAPRPAGDILQGYSYPGVRAPKNPYRLEDLYWLNRTEPVLHTATFNIREEIFRRGLKWKQKFAYICTNPKCKTEFEDAPSEEGMDADKEDTEGVCSVCGSPIRKPSRDGIAEADEFFENVNANGQNLLTVLRQFEDDLNIVDDAYLILRKDYTLTEDNVRTKEDLRAIVRGNPSIIRILADRFDMLGGTYWFCPKHRKGPELYYWTNPQAKQYSTSGYTVVGPDRPKPEDIPKCQRCNGTLWEAAYVATYDGVNPEFFYAEHEVVHASKYEPSMLYGFSPTITLWTVATCLLNQEKYLQEYYREMRLPQGVVAAVTDNPQATYRAWDAMIQRSKEDMFFVPMFAISTQKGKGDMKYIEFRQSPKEMELIAVRDEFRQRVSSQYGVANLFMGDVESSGGLNAEDLQVSVTNRALERGQRVYDEIVFPRLYPYFGIEDYEYVFPRLEMKEDLERAGVEQANLQFAQGMQQLGFQVNVREDEDRMHRFTFSRIDPEDMSQQGKEGEQEDEEGEGDDSLEVRLRGMKPGDTLSVGDTDVREKDEAAKPSKAGKDRSEDDKKRR